MIISMAYSIKGTMYYEKCKFTVDQLRFWGVDVSSNGDIVGWESFVKTQEEQKKHEKKKDEKKVRRQGENRREEG